MASPKLLIISNQCFSMSNSNGRTLGNLLLGWPKECMAQFCLSLVDPNMELCDNYFCVSDSDAVKAFMGKTIQAKKKDALLRQTNNPNPNKTKKYRTAFRMLIRNIVWKSNIWKKCGYDKWVDEFNPDLVLFQSGDAAFMCDLARTTAVRKNIPLVIFNTEGYFFFDHTWLDNHWSDYFCFPLFNWQYRKAFKKLMEQTVHSVYLNSKLQEDYDKTFGTKSTVLYTGSSCKFQPKDFDIVSPCFSYLGNLGLNRPLALIEIAEALQSINAGYYLDVYGKLPRGEEDIFDKCPAVRYHGLVGYEEVQKVIYESDVLFHAESVEGQWIHSLKYAFSTKIADSLASGSNFFLYAPSHLACSKYIIDNKVAWYAEDKSQLATVLKELINDVDKRLFYLENAHKLAEKNHNALRNVETFRKLLFHYAKR